MHVHIVTPIPGSVGVSMEDDIARLKEPARPGTEITVSYVEGNPPSIESEFEDSLAVPGTVQAAIQAEKDGADAIVINCTADTGLKACRECLSIPVVGPTNAAMNLAVQLSHRFSVLTFSKRTIVRFEEMAFQAGFGYHLASIRSVEIPVENMDCTNPALLEDLFAAGSACVQQDGSDAIVLGCTAFEILADMLRLKFAHAGIQVLLVEPYRTAVSLAEALVNLKLSQSKLTYPYPGLLARAKEQEE